MENILPATAQTLLQTQESFARFRRALRRSDQQSLDILLAAVCRHLPLVANAGGSLPFEILLLAMLVEEHRTVLRLRQRIQDLQQSSWQRLG
jgi:hypothetical protein